MYIIYIHTVMCMYIMIFMYIVNICIIYVYLIRITFKDIHSKFIGIFLLN